MAFSGGIDSSALFFLLLEANIAFDIAIVNYNTRAQSAEEVSFAQKLCITHGKKCFIHSCKLDSANFEHYARNVRYSFFEQIITEHHYTTLLTAHHLNDRLEWFLMQLGRGAGLVEMLGMREFEPRQNYTLVRPLLHVSKASLLSFLKKNEMHYFIDESNETLSYLRNKIRKYHATPLIEAYGEGICTSFAYLEKDAKRLLSTHPKRIKDLFIIDKDSDDLINIRQIDKAIKLLGTLISHETRDEILRTKNCVVGGKVAVCFGEEFIFIAPFKEAIMDKKFKELCRTQKIPPKIRPYMYEAQIDINALR